LTTCPNLTKLTNHLALTFATLSGYKHTLAHEKTP
jgi:hypothetical protein